MKLWTSASQVGRVASLSTYKFTRFGAAAAAHAYSSSATKAAPACMHALRHPFFFHLRQRLIPKRSSFRALHYCFLLPLRRCSRWAHISRELLVYKRITQKDSHPAAAPRDEFLISPASGHHTFKPAMHIHQQLFCSSFSCTSRLLLVSWRSPVHFPLLASRGALHRWVLMSTSTKSKAAAAATVVTTPTSES
jgi:hypothetical protein